MKSKWLVLFIAISLFTSCVDLLLLEQIPPDYQDPVEEYLNFQIPPIVWETKIYDRDIRGVYLSHDNNILVLNAEGTLFDTQKTLYCINLSSGEILWEIKSPDDEWFFHPQIDPQHSILLFQYKYLGGLVALDLNTGERLWSNSLSLGEPQHFTFDFSIDPDKIYVTSQIPYIGEGAGDLFAKLPRGVVYCLNKHTGEIEWWREIIGKTRECLIKSNYGSCVSINTIKDRIIAQASDSGGPFMKANPRTVIMKKDTGELLFNEIGSFGLVDDLLMLLPQKYGEIKVYDWEALNFIKSITRNKENAETSFLNAYDGFLSNTSYVSTGRNKEYIAYHDRSLFLFNFDDYSIRKIFSFDDKRELLWIEKRLNNFICAFGGSLNFISFRLLDDGSIIKTNQIGPQINKYISFYSFNNEDSRISELSDDYFFVPFYSRFFYFNFDELQMYLIDKIFHKKQKGVELKTIMKPSSIFLETRLKKYNYEVLLGYSIPRKEYLFYVPLENGSYIVQSSFDYYHRLYQWIYPAEIPDEKLIVYKYKKEGGGESFYLITAYNIGSIK